MGIRVDPDWKHWLIAVFRIRIRPDPKLLNSDPDPAQDPDPDPSLFHTKLRNMFLK